MVVSAAGELARVGVLARAIPPPGPTSLYDWEVARAAVAAAHALAVEPLCQSAAPPDYACAAEGEHGSGRLRGSFFFQVLPCKVNPGLRWGCQVAHLCEVAIQTLDEACVLFRRKCKLVCKPAASTKLHKSQRYLHFCKDMQRGCAMSPSVPHDKEGKRHQKLMKVVFTASH